MIDQNRIQKIQEKRMQNSGINFGTTYNGINEQSLLKIREKRMQREQELLQQVTTQQQSIDPNKLEQRQSIAPDRQQKDEGVFGKAQTFIKSLIETPTDFTEEEVAAADPKFKDTMTALSKYTAKQADDILTFGGDILFGNEAERMRKRGVPEEKVQAFEKNMQDYHAQYDAKTPEEAKVYQKADYVSMAVPMGKTGAISRTTGRAIEAAVRTGAKPKTINAIIKYNGDLDKVATATKNKTIINDIANTQKQIEADELTEAMGGTVKKTDTTEAMTSAQQTKSAQYQEGESVRAGVMKMSARIQKQIDSGTPGVDMRNKLETEMKQVDEWAKKIDEGNLEEGELNWMREELMFRGIDTGAIVKDSARMAGKTVDEAMHGKAPDDLPVTPKKKVANEEVNDMLLKTDSGANIYTEMDQAVAGRRTYRYDDLDRDAAHVFEAEASTFPQWVSPKLRLKDVFEKVQVHIMNGTVPTHTRQKRLYEEIVLEATKREGGDVAAMRAKLKQQDANVKADIKTSTVKKDTKDVKIKPKVTPTKKMSTSQMRKDTKSLAESQGQKIPDEEMRMFREKELTKPENIDRIIATKRGIMTDAEAVEQAKKMQVTIDEIIDAPKGTIYNKEKLTAVSQVVQEQREITQSIKKMIDTGADVAQTPSERQLLERLGKQYPKMNEQELLTTAYEQSSKKLINSEIALMAAKSEAGRATQGAKQFVKSVDSRMRILYGHMKNKTPLERQAIVERILKEPIEDNKNFIKLLEDLGDADMFDKVAEYTTAIKLYNPKTHVVNFGNNLLRQIVDIGVTNITNPQTAKADIQGSVVGFNKGLHNAIKALTDDGYASTLSKYIEAGGQSPSIKGKTGQVVRSSFRALGAADEIFRGMAFERSLYRQAYTQSKGNKKKMTELLENPTLDMAADATQQADRMTFQEEMGDFANWINKGRTPARFESKTAKTASVAMRLFVPFLKTPTNLFKQAVDFSPLGFIKNKNQIAKGFKKGASFSETENARRLVGEAVVGSAFIAWTANQFAEDKITGGTPRNKKEREQFYAEGKKPYAIKIGDTWVQYQRADPISTVVGLVADIQERDLSDKKFMEQASEITNVVAHNLSDKTFTQGMGDLLLLLTGEAWERDQILESTAINAMIPNLSGALARSVDTDIRATDGIVDTAKSQIPGLSQTLPARYNIVGEKADRQKDREGIKSFLHEFLNPVKFSEQTDNPVIQELATLDHALAPVSDDFTLNGETYKLTPEEYEAYSMQIGKEINTQMTQFIQSDKYQDMALEDKRDALDDKRTSIINFHKNEFISNMSEIFGEEQKLMQPTIEQVQDLYAQNKTTEAQNIVDALSDKEYEIYKKTVKTINNKNDYKQMSKMKERVDRVQTLINQNKKEDAQQIVNAMSDEEYRIYEKTVKSLGY